MKTAIIQSNYIPWLGYFNIISLVDNFVFYDEMQYTKRDWRNRNYIKTPEGKFMLTVPVKTKGNYAEKINNIKIADSDWGNKHLKSLIYNYKNSKHFEEIYDLISSIFLDQEIETLSQLNQKLIIKISNYLELNTTFFNSTKYLLNGDKTDNLIEICKDLNTKTYISGPYGKTYIDIDKFTKVNINFQFFDYPKYSEYNQQWGEEFMPNLSILDCLFNCGKDTKKNYE
ncbi:WbqC family protein [Acidimicrobiia bacterium]|jgi:hypothetical protein|nr:WbqC family protein [Acidimicrobiia bacterium]